MSHVKMYTTAVCPYCIRAKQLLSARGVTRIEEIRIDRPRVVMAVEMLAHLASSAAAHSAPKFDLRALAPLIALP